MTPAVMRQKVVALQDFINKRLGCLDSDPDSESVVCCLNEVSRESARLASTIVMGDRQKRRAGFNADED
jgi:hypothetical protein